MSGRATATSAVLSPAFYMGIVTPSLVMLKQKYELLSMAICLGDVSQNHNSFMGVINQFFSQKTSVYQNNKHVCTGPPLLTFLNLEI